jgi:hypothetical protein
MREVRRYSQRRVDVIDLAENRHTARPFEDVVRSSPAVPRHLFASPDPELERALEERGGGAAFTDVLTLDPLLATTTFAETMRVMLRTLHEAYRHAVDIEFTANFSEDGAYTINLLQCRPFQVKARTASVAVPRRVRPDDVVLETGGPVIGGSVAMRVDRIIYVVPAVYGMLPMSDRYAIARLMGRLTHAHGREEDWKILLIGPGRWGTSTPALGIPVSFAEIDTAAVLCEVAQMHEGLVPDLSLGTHFLNDLVELDILCMALDPQREGDRINGEFFETTPNRLAEVAPQAARWAHAVKVVDARAPASDLSLYLRVDVTEQRAICYRKRAR